MILVFRFSRLEMNVQLRLLGMSLDTCRKLSIVSANSSGAIFREYFNRAKNFVKSFSLIITPAVRPVDTLRDDLDNRPRLSAFYSENWTPLLSIFGKCLKETPRLHFE